MKNQSREDIKTKEKLFNELLYDIGYEQMNDICIETEKLLEKYKDIEIPGGMDERIIGHIRLSERKRKVKKMIASVSRLGMRTAAILVCAFFIFGAAIMSVDALRIKFFDIIEEAREKYTAVETIENMNNVRADDIQGNWEGYCYPTIIPEGYQLTDTIKDEFSGIMIFTKDESEEIIFYQGSVTGGYHVDTENGKSMEVEINGHEGLIVEKENSNILMWHDDVEMYYIQGNVDKPTLLKIAENIKEK